MKKLLFLLYLASITPSSIYANIKNLYIIVEPNSFYTEKRDSKKILTPVFKTLLQIGKWISKDKDIPPKFQRVVIQVAGGNTYKFNKRNIDKLSKKKTIIEIYKNTKNIKEYSIADTLAYFPQDLEKLKGWKGEETLLLVMGDINFVKNGISSHGKYLNSFWLESQNSPFVKYFLSKDNTPAKDVSVMVLTRTQLKLNHEKMRQDFIVNLLSNQQVGMNVYYIGESYNLFSAPTSMKSKNNYVIELLKNIKEGKKKPIKLVSLPKTNICQIIGANESITIKNCGR
jgi:hypothetical protein